jgi:signal peptidase I
MSETLRDSPKPKRQNAKWVGIIMALILPGSAHFLSGQRWTGVILYVVPVLLIFLSFILGSAPGVGFFYAALFCSAICILLMIAILISSWRHTPALGCVGWVLLIGIALFLNNVIVCPCAIFLKTYVVEGFTMNGMAMAPTLLGLSESAPEVLRSDRVLASKLIYRMSDPQRGDVATYKTTARDRSLEIHVFRIVGLPGETVDIESPYVLINGWRLTDPPIFAKIASKQNGFTGYCTAQELGTGDAGVPLPLTLGADEYFLLGDNTYHSFDSRLRGPVRRQDITGKIIRISYPLERMWEIE